MNQTISCEGVISVANQGYATCSTGWVVQAAALPFEYSQIDPEIVVAMFGGGFVLAVTVWAMGYGAGQLLKLLK